MKNPLLKRTTEKNAKSRVVHLHPALRRERWVTIDSLSADPQTSAREVRGMIKKGPEAI